MILLRTSPLNRRQRRKQTAANRRSHDSGTAPAPSAAHHKCRPAKKPPGLPCRRWLLLRWRLRNTIRGVRSAQDASCRRTGERNRKPGDIRSALTANTRRECRGFRLRITRHVSRQSDGLTARRRATLSSKNQSITRVRPGYTIRVRRKRFEEVCCQKLAGGRRSSTDFLPRRQPNLPWSAGAMTHRPLVRLLHRPNGRAAAAVLDTPHEPAPAIRRIGSQALRCIFQTHPSTRFPCGPGRH